eukprot:2007231-Lingulodinium_polyedra.AAC.1
MEYDGPAKKEPNVDLEFMPIVESQCPRQAFEDAGGVELFCAGVGFRGLGPLLPLLRLFGHPTPPDEQVPPQQPHGAGAGS